MLAELTIRNFAIIDELRLSLDRAFSVLTGETGAGKSIIVDAVALLLGGRAPTDVIRAGADRTLIEGVFHLEPHLQAEATALLTPDGLEGDDPATLILAREIRREGRNICRINGRAVTLSMLEAIGQRLVDIHGQREHLSLLRVRAHIDYLDRYGELWPQREELGAKVGALQQVRQQLADLMRDERELARRVDLLKHQVREIEAAKLVEGEEQALRAERTRLSNAERLLARTEEAYKALCSSEEGRPGASDLLGEGTRALSQLASIDVSLTEVLRAAEEISYSLADLVSAVRSYRDTVECDPRRLTRVEERLNLVHGLKRKYGDSIEEILAFGRRAAEELRSITHSEERIEELRGLEQTLLWDIGRLGGALSEARRQAADRLEVAVERQLAELSMEGTRFAIAIERREDAEGACVNGRRVAFDRTGIDQVEFLISSNPGEPLCPLARVASGGEASRLMLALKTVLSLADETPTLIFDEIDAGIGGRQGAVLGRKLWRLTPEHQVLCVTHLPQLAAYSDVHFRVAKAVVRHRTVTGAELLDAEGRVAELAAMLGAERPETRQSAQAMLADTAREKRNGQQD